MQVKTIELLFAPSVLGSYSRHPQPILHPMGKSDGAMDTLSGEELKINTDLGLIPATFYKVDSSFHSPGDGDKVNIGCGGRPAWLPYSLIRLL